MTLGPEKYLTIHHLIQEEVPYERIATLLGVNKNTVTATKERYESSGSIYPKRISKSVYDPTAKEISTLIGYYIDEQRPSHQLGKSVPYSRDEIYTLFIKGKYPISKKHFYKLHANEQRKRKDSYLQLYYKPGIITQFDWGALFININGSNNRVSFAVYSWPFSGDIRCYVTFKENSESFSDTYISMTHDTGGITKDLIIDNMKLARKSSKTKRLYVELTQLFTDLSDHFGFETYFCTPAHPHQKGNVENAVSIVKGFITNSHKTCYSGLEEIQAFIDEKLEDRRQQEHPKKNDTIANLFKHEQSKFKPVPNQPFVYFKKKKRLVYRDSYIRFNNSRYSIPEGYEGTKLTVRFNHHHLYVLSSDEVVSKHVVARKSKQARYKIWHLLFKCHDKHRGFINSEEYRSMPTWLKRIHDYTFKGDSLEFIKLLKLAKGKRKDFLKLSLKQNKVDLESLTPDMLYKTVIRL